MKKLNYLLLLLFFLFVRCVSAQYTLTNAFPNLTFADMTDMVNAHDGTNRIFVVTQLGKIYVFPNSPSVSNPKIFLDLSDRVTQTGGETGLLSLVFHPGYSTNRYFFVDYTTSSSPLAEVVSRFSTSPTNPDSALKSSEYIIMTTNKPNGYTNHNGGKLDFGPSDGYLYISRGDGGSEGDPLLYGQDRTVLWGKMLRIDINSTSGGNNYSIPPTNPYYQNSNGWRQEIWAYGLRNPWRYSFDPTNNKLWVGDVGQNLYEEIDILSSGGNYGWSIMEGFHCYNPSTNCDSTGLIPPIWEYPHQQGNCAITGGFVYRGPSVPLLTGKYIYGDYCTGNLYALTYDSVNPAANEFLVNAGFPVGTLGLDQSNEIYVCQYSGNGRIYKFNPYPIGIQKTGNQLPNNFYLHQNYPNPFNPSTKIKFDIPDYGTGSINAKMDIYNYDGQRIANLFDQKFSPGTYEYTWNAEKQPCGVYICRLVINNNEMVKKMVLVK